MGGCATFPRTSGASGKPPGYTGAGSLPAAGRPSPRRRGGGEEPGYKGRGKKEGDVWGGG